MYARILLYLSVPWVSAWIDLFWINLVRKFVASLLNGIDFSGVFMPMSRMYWLFDIWIVSPSMIREIWNVWVVVGSVRW